MAFKIYTKTGDGGKTSLLGGTKISKADLRIDAYGTVDELNAYIGLCKELIAVEEIKSELTSIQNTLFILGSLLAVDPDKPINMELPVLGDDEIMLLENKIDEMEGLLTPMKSFILPGGSVSISNIHVARSVCRRAERCCVRLSLDSQVDEKIIIYLNRLSDYLFVLARYVGYLTKVLDVPWQYNKSK